MLAATATNRDGHSFPITSQTLALPPGDAGTAMTVRIMLEKAAGDEGARHPGVRAFALRACDDCEDRDDWQQAQAIYHAVQKAVKFRGEEGETLQTPWLTLQLGAGDCDDFTTLQVALLRALGIPARVQTIATGGNRNFSHVYAMAGIRERGQLKAWRALDPTVKNTAPGWQPPDATRRQLWEAKENGGTMQGYGYERQAQMNGFFGKLKKFAAKGAKIGIAAGPGIATGNPLLAARGIIGGGMQGYQFNQPPGFRVRSLDERSVRDSIARTNAVHYYGRAYLGDLGGPAPFLDSLSTTEKVIGGLAIFAVVLAVTK